MMTVKYLSLISSKFFQVAGWVQLIMSSTHGTELGSQRLRISTAKVEDTLRRVVKAKKRQRRGVRVETSRETWLEIDGCRLRDGLP